MGKEDRRTKEQKKGKGKGRQKDRRTKEQKQVERGTGARGKKDRRQPPRLHSLETGRWLPIWKVLLSSYGWRVKPNARYAFRAHGLAMT